MRYPDATWTLGALQGSLQLGFDFASNLGADVSQNDSTGLGTLVFGLARLRKAGGRLALVNLDRAHRELFLLTKLAIAFEFFDDEQDAVNSFFPDRALKRFDILWLRSLNPVSKALE